ncbi:MAG TPA: hypothetical protein VKD72_28660, partial [Gemmataceae bacterium]|nr:hypothetical protein [Gemmataceae bacterium]
MSLRTRRVLGGLAALAVMAVVAAAVRQQEPPRHAFRVVVGLKDKEPTDWSGKVEIQGGELASLAGWRFEGKEDAVSGAAWTCKTHNNIAP